jgi:polyisoprenoid-binding protein YceI
MSKLTRLIWLATILPALACVSCASVLAPRVSTEIEDVREGAYRLDKDHASIIFKIRHLGFSNYVGRFERFDVAVDFDENNLEATQVEALIDMTSLDVANDAFAERLMGPNWFDAERHPQARFVSNSIEVTGENTGIVRGDFTMRGVTRPIEMEVIFNGSGFDVIRGAFILGLSAETTIRRSEFGVSRFIPLASDRVRIEIEAELMKAPNSE